MIAKVGFSGTLGAAAIVLWPLLLFGVHVVIT